MNARESPLPKWVPRFEKNDPFLKSWFAPDCMNERRRIMLKSRAGAFGLVTQLHDLVTDYLHFKDGAFLEMLPEPLQLLVKTPKMESLRPKIAEEVILPIIGKTFVDLLKSEEASRMLRSLAEILDRFPLGEGPAYFGDYLSMPEWFKPTLQDGTKAVVLGAFLEIAEKRPLAAESLPTIGELDHAIRTKWKWSGGDKELRDARRELGLSGLPRGKSGRRKKQRGEK